MYEQKNKQNKFSVGIVISRIKHIYSNKITCQYKNFEIFYAYF